jgi:tRNA modification GTPase
LHEARDHLALAAEHAAQRDGALDLLAEELRLAHNALGRITGAFSADDLLGEIFTRFCIGK